MIANLKGTLIEKGLERVVLDVSGVGYEIYISLQTLQALPALKQEVSLLTYLQVREDAMVLYGFISAEEKLFFEKCISVSGVGPKLALSLLSGIELDVAIPAIQSGDIKRLTQVPGIGKKTAERLILELRDKLNFIGKGYSPKENRKEAGNFISKSESSHEQVVSALCRLGYKPLQAEQATSAALEKDPHAPLEKLLRSALHVLQKD